MGRELTDLAERFEAEMESYRKIQAAVKTKQEELQRLYEVETAASDLAALIDAQRVEKESFEQEAEARKTAQEDETQRVRAQWERETAEQATELKKQRQREQEEYEYAFAREKAQRKTPSRTCCRPWKRRSSKNGRGLSRRANSAGLNSMAARNF